jgi:hypothetical protein
MLGGVQITDTGLRHLKGLNELTVLWLPRTKITDSGLETLRGLNKLQLLDLYDTQVTDEGVERLQQALPKCTIFHSRQAADP